MNDFIKESSQNENICLSWKVIKRDGITEVPFEHSKIVNAIKKAFKSVNNTDENCNDTAVVITNKTVDLLEKELNNNKSDSVVFSVEEIQDKVEQALIQLGYSKIAKEYIVYREKRNQVRMMNSSLMQTYKDFVTKPVSEIDEMRENANIDGQNPMGGILKFGSEASKTFVDLYLIKPLHAKYHGEGYLHVHDKDFYTFRTTTCTQIDIKSLLNRGFHTGHGFLRTPGSIISAAALACIAIQSNQADQHGGQSIPNLDYGLAPYVAKTYIKKIIEIFELILSKESLKTIELYLKDYYEKHNDLLSKTAQNLLLEQLAFVTDTKGIEFPDNVQTIIDTYKPYVEKAIERTNKETYQAMEAMVHNFNTLKSRSGGQVPFSSINFGTDTTEEGRMVSRNFLKAIDAGLGKHETSIFPVAIFQVKRGFNYSKEDPNYDLFELSCEVSSRRLFPNFLFEDSSFNKPYYKEGHPETLCAVMGCADGEELVIWRFTSHYSKIKHEIQVTNFKTLAAATRVQFGEWNSYSSLSNYINCYDQDHGIEIWDSSSNDFVKVKTVIQNTGVTNWRRVIFTNGRVLDLTGDHPLPVIDKGRVFVDDLQIVDKIPLVSSYQHVFNNENDDLNIEDDDLKRAWLLGVIICDGSFSRDNEIIVSLGADEVEICDKVEEYSNCLDISKTTEIATDRKLLQREEKGTYYDIRIKLGKKIVSDIIKDFRNTLKKYRTIPSWIFTANRDIKLAFLAGMIDADGYINDKRINSRVQIGSTNKTLALQQALLAESLGYQAKVYLNHYCNDSEKLRYRVEFFVPEDILKYLVCEKKKQLIREFNGKPANEIYCTVAKIEDLAYDPDKLSYDVETETDMFDLSMIQSHNCRTRVLGNTFDPNNQTTYGRGNLSFTTINLPMLALDAVSENPDDAIARFFEKLEHMEDEVFDQLLDRFEYQKHGLVKSFPTLMGQHIWMGSEHLSLEDEVGSILGHGTLTVGFIGLAETLIALTGKAHDESKESQELGLKIVKFMHDKCVKKSNEMKLNFSLIGTPAESTVGTMMRKLRKKYGIIPNVTEHEYLTNSFHCRVYKKLSIKDKIDIEAPYHKYCLAGAISYIELNGDPSKNVKAFMDIVKYAESKDMGYFSINHAVDRCPVCNYVGVIDDACPRCGFSEETGVDLEKLKELQKYYPDITIPKI